MFAGKQQALRFAQDDKFLRMTFIKEGVEITRAMELFWVEAA
jgi:hypothetical protein